MAFSKNGIDGYEHLYESMNNGGVEGDLELSYFNELMERFGMTTIPMKEKIIRSAFLSLREKKYTGFNERIAAYLDFMGKYFPVFPTLRLFGKENAFSSSARARGNELIKKNLIEPALKHYNMAISSAENSSVELSLAYANRSFVNFELRSFEDAIMDIDRALEGQYPDNLKFKILYRKGQCLVHLQNFSEATTAYKEALDSLDFFNASDDEKSELKRRINLELAKIKNKKDATKNKIVLPKLTHSPSDIIYCASEAVKIDSSPIFGRMVIATQNIMPGDILAVEKPYVSCLKEASFLDYCFHCKKRCLSIVPCLQCSEVAYCGENCRKTSWESDHMIECDIMNTILAIVGAKPDFSSLNAFKLLLKMTKQGKKLKKFIGTQEKLTESNTPFPGFKNQKYSANKTSIANLTFNEDFLNCKLTKAFILKACIFVSTLKETAFFDHAKDVKDVDVIVTRLLTKMIFQSITNSMKIYPPKSYPPNSLILIEQELGAVVLPFISLINHSCDFNAYAVNFQGGTFALIALTPISQGQQITISYGPNLSMSKRERQSSLEHMRFTCKCIACEENWLVAEEMRGSPFDSDVFLDKERTENLMKRLIREGNILEVSSIKDLYDEVQMGRADQALLRSAWQSLLKTSIFFDKHLKKPKDNFCFFFCKNLMMEMITYFMDNNMFEFTLK